MEKKGFFINASPVFPVGEDRTLNASFLFVLDLEGDKAKEIRITGVSDYQIYLNGNLIHYGPARSAFQKHQVDIIKLKDLKERNRIVIIYASYRCLSFTRIDESPFLVAEIFDENGNSLNTLCDFTCYVNEAKLRKVIRFSYQREFSESYRFDEKTYSSIFEYGGIPPFQKKECKEVVLYDEYWERYTRFSTLERKNALLLEKGNYILDKNAKDYDDRYLHSDFLAIFPKEEWEIDSNGVASRLKPMSLKALDNTIKNGEFITYGLDVTKTGFLEFEFNVKKNATVYVLFDEIDTNETGKGPIGVLFYRNTTHNVITYELQEGTYRFDAFEPYTAKFIRVFALSGEVEVKNVSIRLFENPDTNRISFSLEDKRLEKVLNGGVNTFAQNAVDILMDCPSRERAGWLCDTFWSGPAENLITGENLVEKSFLRNYCHYYNRGDQPKGMLPMCYPCDYGDKGFIVNWPMFYVLEIANYLKRHDDPKLLDDAKEGIFEFLDYCKRFENEYQLFETEDIHLFVEWSHSNDFESLHGVNYPTNILYAECLRLVGEIYHSPEYVHQSEKMRKKILELSFDGIFFEDNSIRDSFGNLVRSGRICETTQYYAFAFGLASKKSHPELFNLMKEKFGPNRDINNVYPDVYPSNMFIGDYLRLYVMAKEGEYETLKNEIVDYAYSMVEKTGTIWEFDSTYASLTHCFASYVVNLGIELITGITLISEKDKKVYLSSYKPLEIGCFKIELPTPSGKISINKKEGEAINFNLPNGYSISRQ